MKITLNDRQISPNQRNRVERLVQQTSLPPRHLLIEYRDDASTHAVLAIDPEDEALQASGEIIRVHRAMEEGIRAILDGDLIADQESAKTVDTRIWVKPPVDRDTLDGLDVEIVAAGNFTSITSGDPVALKYPGTLICTGTNDYDDVSVRLVTNQPIEDENGREVYRLDLDQASISSLKKDRETNTWTIRLPDRCRPIK